MNILQISKEVIKAYHTARENSKLAYYTKYIGFARVLNTASTIHLHYVNGANALMTLNISLKNIFIVAINNQGP